MKAAVITIVSGRRGHLEHQHDALRATGVRPDSYILVAMGEPELASWRSSSELRPVVIDVARLDGRLPLASARNAGARRALADGAELLIFLDVDCIPSSELVGSYREAARRRPDAVLSGPVGYLPPGANSADRRDEARFPASRPRPPAGELLDADPMMFWSLSFAVTAATWTATGGFDEAYTGYGAEDTDFAQRATSRGIGHVWVGGAEAFHQHHDSQNPPVDHLDDILRNGALFAERWGFWPMRGWLDAFEAQGLVERLPDEPSYRRRVTA